MWKEIYKERKKIFALTDIFLEKEDFKISFKNPL